jgi:hypothetical protein
LSSLSAKIGRSVEIRFGEGKRVRNQFDARFRVICDDYFHDIESEKNVGIIQHSQPRQRASRNSPPFFVINRFHGPAEILATAGFYFDKYQRVIVTADDVYFTTAATAEIAEEDLVTVTLEVAAR